VWHVGKGVRGRLGPLAGDAPVAESDKPRTAGDQPEVRREVRELSLLFEVSQTQERSLDLGEVLGLRVKRLGIAPKRFRTSG